MTEDPRASDRLSLNRSLFVGVFGAGISREALRVAVRQQSYQVAAAAMDVSPEESARVLGEVVTELSQTGASGDAFAIAQRRLAEGEAFRPPKELRDAARQMLAAGGCSLHPEHVDAHAWQLQHLMDAYAPVRVRWWRRAWRWLRKTLRRFTS
jgi:hypothetical protein